MPILSTLVVAVLGAASPGAVILASIGPELPPLLVPAPPSVPGFCSAPDAPPEASRAVAAPEYYGFPLVTTGQVPGSGLARGTARVVFADSPFGVAIAEDGSYVYDLELSVTGLNLSTGGVLTAWLTTPSLDQVVRLGPVAAGEGSTGRVSWNKFLVVLTLEEGDDPSATVWSGPVVLRGMSRSGMMHTMAGHGPFEQENCAAYGYG